MIPTSNFLFLLLPLPPRAIEWDSLLPPIIPDVSTMDEALLLHVYDPRSDGERETDLSVATEVDALPSLRANC